jgi:hypothetical protein
MDLLKRVLAAIPLAAITGLVTDFTKLLHVPWLTHPDWAPTINDSILPIGVIAVLLTFIVFYAVPKRNIRLISIALLVITAALMGLCCWYHVTIDSLATPQAAEAAIARWSYAYISACVMSVCAATTIGLWFTAKPP